MFTVFGGIHALTFKRFEDLLTEQSSLKNLTLILEAVPDSMPGRPSGTR
jgi:hypothetical protein